MKNVDKIFLKVRSRLEVEPQDFSLGQDIEFSVRGCVVKTEVSDNQDGTCDMVYVIKPLEPAKIIEYKHESN